MEPDLGWPLQRAAHLHGDAVALQDGERALSYRDAARRVGSLATALDELGVAVGGRVGFLGANSIAHLECWLGIPAAGRVLTDLNFRLALEELAFLVDDSGMELLIADRENLDVAAALRARCPSVRQLVVDDPAAVGTVGPPGVADPLSYEALTGHVPAPARPIRADELAAISYTGGTTGRPKGVMLSHRNLMANAMHNLVITGHRSSDTFLHVCPMFHAAGIANVFASTWVGARQVILPRFKAESVTAAIAREHVTLTVLVPTMIARWLEYLDDHPADLSSLRNFHYAASPISAALQRRLLATLRCEVAQMYGMTEAAPTVTHLSPEVHRRGYEGHEPERTRLGSMGVPVPGVQVQVRDLDDRPLPAGEIGELWVAGANVMLGYWNREDATASTLVDGWYRTGDAAYSDDGGYLFMVDRLKDMIISGGENVYSIEVENALLEHPSVAEAAVFGVPDATWGERVHAVVVLETAEEVDAEQLRAHCRAHIAGFKVPRSFEIRRSPLPRSGAGKILKAEMRRPFWQDAARNVS